MTAALLTGCASPGLPGPPSLHLPAPVADLTASRIGNNVELHWTPPTRTTDGLDLTRPTTVVICRDPAPSILALKTLYPPCTATSASATQPGASSAIDRLPAALVLDSPQRPWIAYRIRVLNQAGRSAAPSFPALVPGGPAPAPVKAFHATQQKSGVVLEWQNPDTTGSSSGDQAVVEVVRTQLSPGPNPQHSKPVPHALKPAHAAPPAEIRLRPDNSTASLPGASHSAGMMDQTAQRGETYLYSAQRVLAIPATGKPVEVRSEPTPPVTVATQDTFPPDAPTGLLSVPGLPGISGSQATIDLSWQPNSEADLAGYMVYRADLGTASTPVVGKLLRLTPTPIPASTYRDVSPLPAHRYEYRVTAIDRNGNESTKSSPIEDSPQGR